MAQIFSSTSYVGFVFLFKAVIYFSMQRNEGKFYFSLCGYPIVLAEVVELLEMHSQVN
jgi:hypothetical protein